MDRFGYVKVIDTAAYERNKEAAEAESRFLFPCKNTGKVSPPLTSFIMDWAVTKTTCLRFSWVWLVMQTICSF